MTRKQDRWSDPNKYKARQEVIVAGYRRFVANRLPNGQKFYSLCGEQGGGMSEMRCLLDAGLIGEEQFVGIDGDDAKISGNADLFPRSEWICGDWLDTLNELSHKDGWNPAVVHVDTLNMSDGKAGVDMALGTMNLVSSCCHAGLVKHPVLVVANLVVRNPHSGRVVHPDNFRISMRGAIEHQELYLKDDELARSYSYRMRGGKGRGRPADMRSYRFLIRPL